MSDSLRPHGLHLAGLHCAWVSSEVCSNSCPLSWWCYLTISSSTTPFSFYLDSFPALGSFPMSQLSTSAEKESDSNAGDTEGGNDRSLQYCLKNTMDRGAWWAAVQKLSKSWTIYDYVYSICIVYIWLCNPYRAICVINDFKMFSHHWFCPRPSYTIDNASNSSSVL